MNQMLFLFLGGQRSVKIYDLRQASKESAMASQTKVSSPDVRRTCVGEDKICKTLFVTSCPIYIRL